MRRRSNSSCLPNNTPINPIPGIALFAPHSFVGLSAAIVASFDKSLSKLTESSSNSELSDKETDRKSKSVPGPETIGSTRISKKAAIKAVTAMPFSNGNANDNIPSDCGGTPTKV